MGWFLKSLETKPTLSLLGVYQLFHDENGHWTLFKQNLGIDCDKHKDQDHAEVLIESEDVFDLFRMLSEEQFTNHKRFYNKEYKYQDKENVWFIYAQSSISTW